MLIHRYRQIAIEKYKKIIFYEEWEPDAGLE